MARDGQRAGSVVLRALGVVLQPTPVVTMLATAAILAAALKTAPFGLPLAVMLLSWTARYSIVVLESLGAGARAAPVLSVEMILGTLHGWRSFLAMLSMVSLLFATGAAAFWTGPVVAIAMGALAVLVLPLALLILGWSNDFAAAINPRNWTAVVRALGRHFLQMEVVGVAVITATGVLLSGAVHLHLIIRIAAAMFGWLLLVALAGVIIHARRRDLAAVMPFYGGIELAISPAELARQRQQAMDAIYEKWRNGARAEAWRAIELRAESVASRDTELRLIYRQSLTWDAAALSARIAQELIDLDLRAGRSGYALSLLRERLEADRRFRPRAAQETLELARLAAQCADPATALALLADFDQQTTDGSLLGASAQLREELRARGTRPIA